MVSVNWDLVTPRGTTRSNVGGFDTIITRDLTSGHSLPMTKSANLSKVLAIFSGDSHYW